MSGIQLELGLSDEAYRELKLFNRVLISYNDFNQAYEVANLLLDGDFYEQYPRKNRQLVIALNMAAIIAYARPFLDSKGDLAHNRLPGKVTKILTDDELEVHEAALQDRNTMMAHSDADANVSVPLVVEIGGKPKVVPKNATPYENILTKAAMERLRSAAIKLREDCFQRRQEMESEMISILPRANADDSRDA